MSHPRCGRPTSKLSYAPWNKHRKKPPLISVVVVFVAAAIFLTTLVRIGWFAASFVPSVGNGNRERRRRGRPSRRQTRLRAVFRSTPTMVSAAAARAARDGMMEYLVLYHNGGSIDDTRHERGRQEGGKRARGSCSAHTHTAVRQKPN